MTILKAQRDHDHLVASEAASARRNESFSNCMLSILGISGAIIGAVCGIVLGAEFDTAFPLIYGTLGTMLGSGLFAGIWCVTDHLGTVLLSATSPDHNAAERGALNPETNRG